MHLDISHKETVDTNLLFLQTVTEPTMAIIIVETSGTTTGTITTGLFQLTDLVETQVAEITTAETTMTMTGGIAMTIATMMTAEAAAVAVLMVAEALPTTAQVGKKSGASWEAVSTNTSQSLPLKVALTTFLSKVITQVKVSLKKS